MDDRMSEETTLAASAIRKALDLARKRAESARAEVVRLELALSELAGVSRVVPDMSVMARILRVLAAAPDGLLRAEVEARLWDDGGERLGPNTVQCALRRGAVRGLLAHEQARDQRTGGGRPPKRWRLATSEGGRTAERGNAT